MEQSKPSCKEKAIELLCSAILSELDHEDFQNGIPPVRRKSFSSRSTVSVMIHQPLVHWCSGFFLSQHTPYIMIKNLFSMIWIRDLAAGYRIEWSNCRKYDGGRSFAQAVGRRRCYCAHRWNRSISWECSPPSSGARYPRILGDHYSCKRGPTGFWHLKRTKVHLILRCCAQGHLDEVKLVRVASERFSDQRRMVDMFSFLKVTVNLICLEFSHFSWWHSCPAG